MSALKASAAVMKDGPALFAIKGLAISAVMATDSARTEPVFVLRGGTADIVLYVSAANDVCIRKFSERNDERHTGFSKLSVLEILLSLHCFVMFCHS